jgi:hypothetical protein
MCPVLAGPFVGGTDCSTTTSWQSKQGSCFFLEGRVHFGCDCFDGQICLSGLGEVSVGNKMQKL